MRLSCQFRVKDLPIKFVGYTTVAIDSSRSLYFSSLKTEARIPIGLDISLSDICWDRRHFLFKTDTPSDTFQDEVLFKNQCAKTLYTLSENQIGDVSLINLIISFSNLESQWYQQVLDQMDTNLPNSEHVDIVDSSQTQQLREYITLKKENSSRHLENYGKLIKSPSDQYKLFKFDLVGVNKTCFGSQDVYQDIFNWGVLLSLFDIEEYSITKVGVGIEAYSNLKLKNKSIRKLERKLANSSNIDNLDSSSIKQDSNILNNLYSIVKHKNIPKTAQSVTLLSLKDMHSLAANSILSIYSTQDKTKQLFLALVILSGITIFIIACAEYDYRITKKNKCSKVCYLIMLCILFLGVFVTCILIIISSSILSKILRKLEENTCLDPSFFSQIKDDMVIQKLLIPVCVGFGLTFLVGLLGVSLSCHFCRKRSKHRIWKPFGGRFA